MYLSLSSPLLGLQANRLSGPDLWSNFVTSSIIRRDCPIRIECSIFFKISVVKRGKQWKLWVQALRDYYYQVKACTTWCVKMSQSAILLMPEYLSRATMQLPINIRPSTNRCFREHSNRPHHTLLQDRQSNSHSHSLAYSESTDVQSPTFRKDNTQSQVPSANSLQVLSQVPRSINQVSVQPRRKVLLQVLPVQINSPRGVVDTYAALDAGSDLTIIRRDLADHLRLGG
ncbi:hypothetical protein P5673_030528 [Acropora cervicornis]|uniref:Uncharacterized protein n=1 Tax=Acropora cervicornis TaxID=6130 RepID=A0AAD9UTI9_ACRCE|nr:hypothetical protein P5673_030528 [Acropora cervicornis]